MLAGAFRPMSRPIYASVPVEEEEMTELRHTSKPVFKRSREELAQKARALRTASSIAEVAAVLHSLHGGGEKQFNECLWGALTFAGLGQEVGGLFSAILTWALVALDHGMPDAFPKDVQLWTPGSGPQRVVYTVAQCRGLLANALLLNVEDTCADLKDSKHLGGLNLSTLLLSTVPIAAQKLACLLYYFHVQRSRAGGEGDSWQIAWERRCDDESLDTFREWAERDGQTRSCNPATCDFRLHPNGMEAVEDADAFVNFANPNFGYGRFIPSCTQEEIIQVCCPEFNVGMLHQGTLAEGEVIVTEGVARYCSYTGYGKTFRFAGEFKSSPSVQAILSMDSTTRNHFSVYMNLRDIRKAYLAFQGHRLVSTGKWGCGIFCGVPVHKFIQQVIAASLAGCGLRFSTFGDADLCDKALDLLEETTPSATTLLEALLKACDLCPPEEAERFLTTLGSHLRQQSQRRILEQEVDDIPEHVEE